MISENYYTVEPAKAWSFYGIPDLAKTEADSKMLEEVAFTLDPLSHPSIRPLNDDITRFISVDLNSSLQPKYIANYLVC